MMGSRAHPLPRRRVVEAFKSTHLWLQTWQVLLSCGHKGYATGKGNRVPATATCGKCATAWLAGATCAKHGPKCKGTGLDCAPAESPGELEQLNRRGKGRKGALL